MAFIHSEMTEDKAWMIMLDAPNASIEGLMTRAEYDLCASDFLVRYSKSNFRRYSDSNDWVDSFKWKVGVGTTSTMGMTVNGMCLLVTLPQVGERIEAKQIIGNVEGSKSTRQIIAPISGTVVEVNKNLEADPTISNKTPERNGWMITIDAPGATVEGLMNRSEYESKHQRRIVPYLAEGWNALKE